MKKYIIYKYTSPSKRSYIGLTCDEAGRKQDHRNSEFNETIQTKFARALRKYGFDKFTYEVIDSADTWEELGEKEKYWIKFYDSVNSGYNICDGGHTNIQYKFSQKQIEDVQLLLRIGDLTLQEISNLTNVSLSVISNIKNGKGSRNLEVIKRKPKYNVGSENRASKLTEETARAAKEDLARGISRRDIQSKYGISKSLVQQLATGKIWSHVEAEYTYVPKEVNGNAKLTIEIVRELKKDLPNMTRKEISEKYGISIPTVDQIKAGKTWKDI